MSGGRNGAKTGDDVSTLLQGELTEEHVALYTETSVDDPTKEEGNSESLSTSTSTSSLNSDSDTHGETCGHEYSHTITSCITMHAYMHARLSHILMC